MCVCGGVAMMGARKTGKAVGREEGQREGVAATAREIPRRRFGINLRSLETAG